MHKTRTKALSWLLSFALVLGLMPGMSLTAWAAEKSLNGISADYTAQDGETLAGNLVGNHKISIADGATVTLKDATISLGSGAEYAGITCVGSATIVLEGENSVMGGIEDDMGTYPGIYVPDGSTLTIKGTGSLSASCNISAQYGGVAAGIGAGYQIACGNIVIAGGTITAVGGYNAAAIGGGGLGNCGYITVEAGTVTANGGDYAAAIGSGTGSTCGNISITGGKVTATGGENGAGIGSGAYGSCISVTIQDTVTKVTATKGKGAPNSIGVSLVDTNEGGSCGTVTIGGTVYWI